MDNILLVGKYNTGKTSTLINILKNASADTVIICDTVLRHPEKSIGYLINVKQEKKSKLIVNLPGLPYNNVRDYLFDAGSFHYIFDLSEFVESSYDYRDFSMRKYIR